MVALQKEQVFISLVLYTCNDATSIGSTITSLFSILSERFDQSEIIIVNDYSTDNTVSLIEDTLSSLPKGYVTLIDLGMKHGLEKAIQLGLEFAIGDFVIEVDSPQMPYDPSLLYALYEQACEGYDIVSLEPSGMQRMGSRIFYWLFNRFSNIMINADTQIAHILTRRAINSMSTIKDKTKYRKILHIFSGYKRTTIPVQLTQNIPSSYSLTEKIRMSSDILFSFTNLGIQINIYIALSFLLFSVAIGGYALYQFFTYRHIIEGWTTIMLFLSVSFSGIFMVLAIVNKYFAITLREIRTLPEHIIKNIRKL